MHTATFLYSRQRQRVSEHIGSCCGMLHVVFSTYYIYIYVDIERCAAAVDVCLCAVSALWVVQLTRLFFCASAASFCCARCASASCHGGGAGVQFVSCAVMSFFWTLVYYTYLCYVHDVAVHTLFALWCKVRVVLLVWFG